MGLQIEPRIEERINELAEARGCSPDQLLSQVLQAGLSRVEEETSEKSDDVRYQKETRRQREGLRELLREIEQMEPEGPDDGWDSSRHDEVIYRIDW